MKTVRLSSLDRNLYENLFLNHSREETFQLLSDGILAFVTNADRLYGDAQLLFKQGRWTSGRFLLTTANEEMAKPYIFLDACRLDFSRHQSTLIRLCYAFYDHIYKYAYNNVLNSLKVQNIQDGKIEWLESVERWTPYAEKEDIAEYNYSMGSGIPDSESALERLKKTQQLGLFSPSVLNLMNDNFKKYYFSDTTADESLINLHNKTAKQIETITNVSAKTYQESSLHTIPLYHFLTLQK